MISGENENTGSRRRSAFPVVAGLVVLAVAGWLVFTRYLDPAANLLTASGDQAAIVAAPAPGGVAQAQADVPTFDVVRVTRSGTGVITGHAPASALVDVFTDGRFFDKAEADDKGDWSLFFTEPLKVGGVELGLQLHNQNLRDKKPVQSSTVAIVVVPAGVSDRFIEGDSDGVVAVLNSHDHAGHTVILQRPGPATAGDVADGLGFGALDYGDDGKATLSGNAPAFANLQVYLDNHVAGAAATNKFGKWFLPLDGVVSVGKHLLRLDQVDNKGKVSARLEAPFERSAPLASLKAEEKIRVLVADGYWQIARKIPGDGFHYIVIFKVTKDQVKDPEANYPAPMPVLAPEPASAQDGAKSH
jgi:hypothetical protein